jgi:hypothetical protein
VIVEMTRSIRDGFIARTEGDNPRIILPEFQPPKDDEDVSRMKNAQTAFEIMTQLPIKIQAGTATTLTEQGVRTADMKTATSRILAKLIEQRKALN